MKILALTRYSKMGASSRFRFFQFIPRLNEAGYSITLHPLLGDNYIDHLYKKKPTPVLDIIKSYLTRFKLLAGKNKYDLIWLQQEAFPWIPAWIEKLFLSGKVPLIVDHDDAFFHRYDLHKSLFIRRMLGKKIDGIMYLADTVVVGNQYLADRAIENKCRKVTILPTVIDLNRYSTENKSDEKDFTIGWIGSPSTGKYLKSVEQSLTEIQNEGDVKISIVGSGKIEFDNLHAEFINWSEDSEETEIQKFDVGVMPLSDTPWERGKCGFKLIQYMASGKPVVASPVGVNSEIVKHGINGYLAETQDEWKKFLLKLKSDPELRKKMGESGRAMVEENYSLQSIAPKLIEEFNNLLRKDG